MKDYDLFPDLDDETIDRLAQEFPVLTDEEKERMFAMSERKYNFTDSINTDFNSETEVSGVEVYKRPKWRTASIAASLALLIGAGGFGGYNISKQLSNGENDDPNSPTTVSEDLSQAVTAVGEDPRTEEYRKTAEALLDEYNDFLEPYDYDAMPKYEYDVPDEGDFANMTEEEREAFVAEYDKRCKEIDAEHGQSYDNMWFDVGIGDPIDHINYTYIGTWNYTHFDIGMKLSSTDEVMEKALSFMSQSLIDKQFPDLIGEDLTNYEPDRSYDQSKEKCPNFGTYAMCNGKLFCNNLSYDSENVEKIPSTYRFYNCLNEPIVITDIEDNSFTATVKYEFTNVPNKYDMEMKIVKKDGSWMIDDIEPTGPELDEQKLEVIDKMMNSVDLYDKISAKNAYFCKAPEGSPDDANDYSVSYDILYADNRAAREYKYGYISDRYDGSEDIADLNEYAKKTIDPDHERESEDYCDGEKYYYWHNPMDLDGDESNGKEYSWYDWNNYFYRDSDADKYEGFEALRLSSDHEVNYSRSTNKIVLCPSGQGLVTNYLYEFKNWDITGDINFEGRDCYIIEGKFPEKDYDDYYRDSFLLYIDKETGIPMVDIAYRENGVIDSVDMYFDVKLNDKAEPVPEKDMSWFDTSIDNYK